MAPYIQQRIDELTTETSITQSSALSDVTAAAASTLLYWFSGTNLTTTGVQAQWHAVNGGMCLYREIKLDPLHSLLSDSLYEGDLALIHSGVVAGTIFSVPCNSFSVSRVRPHKSVRPVRTLKYVTGLPNAKSDRDRSGYGQGLQHPSRAHMQCGS